MKKALSLGKPPFFCIQVSISDAFLRTLQVFIFITHEVRIMFLKERITQKSHLCQ